MQMLGWRSRQHNLSVLLLFDLVEKLIDVLFVDVSVGAGAIGFENLVGHG